MQAILFDFDGVILDTEWPIYETWRNLYADHGQELTLETYAQCIGSDFDTWSPETHLETLTGKTFDWPTINAQRQHYIESNLENTPPLPGIRELFDHLKEAGIPLAVVSSSSHNWVDRWLNSLGLMSYPQVVICKGDAPRIKPAPDLFLEAARQLKLDPADCLVIEDSGNGMKAAHAAGMPVVAIPNRITAHLDFSAAQHQFSTAQEFLESLR